ncbi:Hypothetical_protein [Hexamita inflata]|uniref:Hypothetical_protein n=1 Tax=Hexamita inflata TaxID=28002 RepID=A0AA86NE34_9EUKA|nr:Hypothetical protein HINF_LOCUS5469 [Hexamita inflata]
MSVLMRRENTLIIEPGSDISKIQIINFILLPNSKKHFEGPPLQLKALRAESDQKETATQDITQKNGVLQQNIISLQTKYTETAANLQQNQQKVAELQALNVTLQHNNKAMGQAISKMQQEQNEQMEDLYNYQNMLEKEKMERIQKAQERIQFLEQVVKEEDALVQQVEIVEKSFGKRAGIKSIMKDIDEMI